jgi:hypothetical protein
LIDEETGAVIKDWRDEPTAVHPRRLGREPDLADEDPDDRAELPPYRRSRRKRMGQGNRIAAGVGAGLLLTGLFLPMVTAPFGIWVSFIDLPWKAVTIGLTAAAEAEEDQGEARREHPPRRDGANKTDGPPGIIVAVAAIAVLYPVCMSVVIAATCFQICAGTSRGAFTVLGGMSLLATLFYGISLLAISAQKDFRIVMIVVSPGFGWAVVLIGALALTSAGVIDSEPRS